MPINPPERARAFQVLDPCLLGRPVHLLPAFASRLAESLGAVIASPSGRRHWGGYRLSSLSFERAPEDQSLRWLGVHGQHGMAAVAFERVLLLGLLEGRYARRMPSAATLLQRDITAERVTATEERLAAALARQLVQVVDARVADGLAAAGQAVPAPVSYDDAPMLPSSAPGKDGFVIRVVLHAPYATPPVVAEGETPPPVPTGQIWIGLDQQLMGAILQGLMAERGVPRQPRMPSEPLAAQLQVRLDGRLVRKEVTLAALFDLKVGDVIPVTVGRADVLLDDARVFTAAVAEHKGKLCLTSFEDAE